MIPLFSTTASIGKSILTPYHPKKDKDPDGPRSIFSLVGEGKIAVAETTLIGAPIVIEACEDLGIDLDFGLIANVIMEGAEGEDYTNKSKIIIFAKDDQGYKDLIHVHHYCQQEFPFFEGMKNLITENLWIAIPFYDSFLAKNSLEFSAQAPKLSDVEHVFFLEGHGLPFDHIIRRNIDEYVEKNGSQTQDVFSIFYEKEEDIEAYMTFRLITSRSGFKGRKPNISRPNLNHFGSNQFSWEAYCAQI